MKCGMCLWSSPTSKHVVISDVHPACMQAVQATAGATLEVMLRSMSKMRDLLERVYVCNDTARSSAHSGLCILVVAHILCCAYWQKRICGAVKCNAC